ncbi:unnamed protein product, partial [Ectocarpus sp. 13 AM-2016]
KIGTIAAAAEGGVCGGGRRGDGERDRAQVELAREEERWLADEDDDDDGTHPPPRSPAAEDFPDAGPGARQARGMERRTPTVLLRRTPHGPSTFPLDSLHHRGCTSAAENTPSLPPPPSLLPALTLLPP